MDPEVTLERLLDAFGDDDRHEALEALDDLIEWVTRGGHLPQDPREET